MLNNVYLDGVSIKRVFLKSGQISVNDLNKQRSLLPERKVQINIHLSI